MKIQKSNLGKALSREEMKNVKGGSIWCAAGGTVGCKCNDGRIINIPTTGNYALSDCVNSHVCSNSHGAYPYATTNCIPGSVSY